MFFNCLFIDNITFVFQLVNIQRSADNELEAGVRPEIWLQVEGAELFKETK